METNRTPIQQVEDSVIADVDRTGEHVLAALNKIRIETDRCVELMSEGLPPLFDPELVAIANRYAVDHQKAIDKAFHISCLPGIGDTVMVDDPDANDGEEFEAVLRFYTERQAAVEGLHTGDLLLVDIMSIDII